MYWKYTEWLEELGSLRTRLWDFIATRNALCCGLAWGENCHVSCWSGAFTLLYPASWSAPGILLSSPPVGVVAWAPIFAEPVLSTRTSMECLKGETKVIYPHSSWTREDMLFVVRFLLLRVWSTKDNINQALAASPEDSRLGILLTQEGLRCKAGQKDHVCPHCLTRCHNTVFLCPCSSLVD